LRKELKMVTRLIFLVTIGLCYISIAFAQDSSRRWLDSLSVSIGTYATVASEDFMPFWLIANQYGTIKDRKNDLSTDLYLHNQHIFNRGRNDSLQLSYTFDVYNNNHFEDFTLVEANTKLRYRGWELRLGRYREIIGEVDPSLSTGSLGISGNALPIPKISIAVPEYKDFPFTKGWLQFKGLFSHGWMGNNRYYQSYLHEKAFYLRAGRGKFKVYGGVVHFGEWGGKRGNFSLDRSLSGFFDVLFVKEANDGSLPSTSGARPNRAGDQRGMLEFGADWESQYGNWHFYHQTPFESGTGIDIRNIDRLAGLSLTFKEPESKVKKLLAEFIYTKQMESFGGEQQSYYNNGTYKTGWEYEGMILGTPLFLNKIRGSHFFPIVPINWDRNEGTEGRINGNTNIISNRIIGGNIGAEYAFWPKIRFKTILTYNVHFMDRSVIAKIANDRYRQFYALQAVESNLSRRWQLLGKIAWDAGDFYHNFGAAISAKYIIF